MKFYSVAIVAIFCAVAVSATSDPALEELPFGSLGLADNYKRKFECARDAIRGIADIHTGEVGDFLSKLEDLLDTNCLAAGGVKDYVKCKLNVARSLNKLYLKFLYTLSMTNLKLANEIRQKVYVQCFKPKKPASLYDFEDGFNPEEVIPEPEEKPQEKPHEKPVRKLTCTIKAISDAVKDTEFANMFEEYRKELEQSQKNLIACKNNPSKVGAIKCVVSEVKTYNNTLFKFFTILKGANQDVFKRVRGYVGKCFA